MFNGIQSIEIYSIIREGCSLANIMIGFILFILIKNKLTKNRMKTKINHLVLIIINFTFVLDVLLHGLSLITLPVIIKLHFS